MAPSFGALEVWGDVLYRSSTLGPPHLLERLPDKILSSPSE